MKDLLFLYKDPLWTHISSNSVNYLIATNFQPSHRQGQQGQQVMMAPAGQQVMYAPQQPGMQPVMQPGMQQPGMQQPGMMYPQQVHMQTLEFLNS